MKKLTVFLDVDGVLLDYYNHDRIGFAKDIIPLLEYLIECDQIIIVWATAWFTGRGPKYQRNKGFGLNKEWLTAFFNDSSKQQRDLNNDELYTIELLNKIVDKAIFRSWFLTKSVILSKLVWIKQGSPIFWIEDGAEGEVEEKIYELTGDLQDSYFHVDHRFEENSLGACLKKLKEKVERL
jgi:hypothetical protein